MPPETEDNENQNDMQAGIKLPPTNPMNTEDNEHGDTESESELSDTSLYTEVSEHCGHQSCIIKQLLQMER